MKKATAISHGRSRRSDVLSVAGEARSKKSTVFPLAEFGAMALITMPMLASSFQSGTTLSFQLEIEAVAQKN
jgi:hypothetical protein